MRPVCSRTGVEMSEWDWGQIVARGQAELLTANWTYDKGTANGWGRWSASGDLVREYMKRTRQMDNCSAIDFIIQGDEDEGL